MNDEYTSLECPKCGEMAISGRQEAHEHATETCECPNGHLWERTIKTRREI